MTTIIVNTAGGPGSGKSTLSYGLIAMLKARGHKAELVPEYAKELTYRRDWKAIENQFEVTREQDRRLRDLLGQVDWVIHESALPLGILYAQSPFDEDWFIRRTWEMYEGYRNFTIFVKRVKAYQEYGRSQTENEAKALDKKIFDLFGPQRIDLIVEGSEGSVETAYEALMKIPR